MGALSRKESERLLLSPGNEPGTYLIRESETSPGLYRSRSAEYNGLYTQLQFHLVSFLYFMHASKRLSSFIMCGFVHCQTWQRADISPSPVNLERTIDFHSVHLAVLLSIYHISFPDFSIIYFYMSCWNFSGRSYRLSLTF